MDKANLALADYLLEQETPIHVVSHGVDERLRKHPLAKVHIVARPGGSFFLGEPILDMRGRSVAREVVGRWPQAHVLVNGGNCIWPGINWAHYVHHAWRAPVDGSPVWYQIKSRLNESWVRRREQAAFERARLVITNSDVTSRHVVEHLHVDERRVHTVYLGSDPEWGPVRLQDRAASRELLQVSPSRPLAVFVGALGFDGRKGFDTLFDAWRRLCAKPDWDADLLVAGGGNALDMWQAKVSQSGLAERIRLLGFSDRVKHILAAADLLVSPVRYEAYGLNVQEAISRGIPALVSASAGVAERYPAELAPMLLPDPEDVSDLVTRLQDWRAGMDRWKSEFQPLGLRLRNQTWHRMAEEMVALVESATQTDGNNPQALAAGGPLQTVR